MLFEEFYHSFGRRIESKLASEYWLWKLVAFSVFISLFLAFPPYSLLLGHLSEHGMKLDAWVFVQNQSHDLFHPQGMDLDVRRENMIFRWVLPLLSFLTGHNVVIIVLLQSILGVFFIYEVGRWVYSVSKDKITTALFVVSIANIFVCTWTFADIYGYGDGFAYFFLLVALLKRNPAIIFIALQIAFFTDERAVIAGGYLLIFHILIKAYELKDFRLVTLLKNIFSGPNIWIWFAWIFYFAVRFYVKGKYFPDHSYSTLGTPVLFADAHRYGLGSSLWTAFEGTWLLMSAAILALWLTKKYILLLGISLGFIVLIATGIYVHDIDRALSYGFPFLLMALYILFQTVSLRSIRLILFFTATVCVIHPMVYYMGYNRILWMEPFPVKIFMLFDYWMKWDLFS
ncbi:hypothetical protein ACFP1I_24820 [Dyadobacter subterraneus]|uniref:Uncharacterized protein n=1 Tax=Dyadobacter subterraneus TaxID=2773304 RepID=A0ABR9WML7_9BACT|nr:hypothetical protein [Dyadobacter subterraneus]MBE9466329.1 hypothetical protein [Dyadobacter subterraneus]